MVPRYARPDMTALWEPEAKYRIWFEIETFVLGQTTGKKNEDDRLGMSLAGASRLGPQLRNMVHAQPEQSD